jgi:ATP-dependent helicase STH1/SNF2
MDGPKREMNAELLKTCIKEMHRRDPAIDQSSSVAERMHAMPRPLRVMVKHFLERLYPVTAPVPFTVQRALVTNSCSPVTDPAVMRPDVIVEEHYRQVRSMIGTRIRTLEDRIEKAETNDADVADDADTDLFRIEVKKLRLMQMQTEVRSKILTFRKRPPGRPPKWKTQEDIAPPQWLFPPMFRPPLASSHTSSARAEMVGSTALLETTKPRQALMMKKKFVRELIKHRLEFFSFHRDVKSKRKTILQGLQNKQKLEEKKLQKQQKIRIDALKNENEDEYIRFARGLIRYCMPHVTLYVVLTDRYIRLVQDSKNERLLELLKKTSEFMQKIGAKVQITKEGKEREAKDIVPDTPVDSDLSIAEQIKAMRETYYQLTHTIIEEIEQPKILKGGTLRDYQLQGVKWLVSLYNNKLNGILADEMGLGKTIQAMSLIGHLFEAKQISGPFLIIAPLSVLRNNWSQEIITWLPSLVSIVYDGPPERRKELKKRMLDQPYNIVLTTYEFAMKDKGHLGKIKWQYIIVDEAHRLKSRECKLSKDLNKSYHSERRLALTGTPLQNDLAEVWSLLNFLHPTIFDSGSNHDFEEWFNAPFAGVHNSESIEMNQEEKLLVIDRLHKVLRPFLLRRDKTQVERQMPKKVEKVLSCDMSALQKYLYASIRDTGVVYKKKYNNILMQLKKVCNHPYLFPPWNEYEYEVNAVYADELCQYSGKFALLDNILPKLRYFKHRVLVFNQMTQASL